MLHWHDSRVGTREFVRNHARNKPARMQETARAAEQHLTRISRGAGADTWAK